MKVEKQLQFKNNPSIQGVTGDRKGEHLLQLSLPALVKGQDARGKTFEEYSEIEGISAEQVVFSLKTPVQIGSRLQIVLTIPATVMLVHALKLELRGKVSRAEMKQLGRKKLYHLVVEPDQKFQLQPISSNQN